MQRQKSLIKLIMFLLLLTLIDNVSNIKIKPVKNIKTLKVVSLIGGNMEIIEEEMCSNSLVRLTCRSFRAFIFIIQADYKRNVTNNCGYNYNELNQLNNEPKKIGNLIIKLRRMYIDKNDDNHKLVVDFRSSLNRRCSGHHHCRYSFIEEHPGAHKWNPANLQIKYACVPEKSVEKYCNKRILMNSTDDPGYLKSPGYPLYYPGDYKCGWIFEATDPAQKISLTFHDFNIRNAEKNGSCVDIVKIEENGEKLLETCGSLVGIKIISKSNKITLNLIAATKMLYPSRGFLVEYEAIGCPDIKAPNGSFISNDSLESRTFKCHSGSVFPDTKQRLRTLDCKKGHWNESTYNLPTCTIASSAAILKIESENNHISSLSSDKVLRAGLEFGKQGEDAVAIDSVNVNMEQTTQSNTMKQADSVRDIIIPATLMVLLFVGNAIIVYIIFQYRKRKLPAVHSAEEVALKTRSTSQA